MSKRYFFISSLAAFALNSHGALATAIDSSNVVGVWDGTLETPNDQPSYAIHIELKSDGTLTYLEKLQGAPYGPCIGSYSIKNGIISSEVNCSNIPDGKDYRQTIDLSQASLEDVTVAGGKTVLVRSTLYDNDPKPFFMKKTK